MPIDAANPYQPPHLGDDGVLVAQLVHAIVGLTIDYQNTIDDSVAFSMQHNLWSPSLRRQRLRLRLMVVVVLLAVAGAFSMQKTEPEVRWLLSGGFVLWAIAYFFTQPMIHRWRLQRMVRAMFQEGTNYAAFGPHRLTLSPEYVTYATPVSQSVVRWIGIEKVVVTEQAIYLYMSATSAANAPRRAFDSAEAFDEFAAVAQKYWTESRRGLV